MSVIFNVLTSVFHCHLLQMAEKVALNFVAMLFWSLEARLLQEIVHAAQWHLMIQSCIRLKWLYNMWIFVGLGNPGTSYVNTRHNAGAMMVEYLHGQGSFSSWRKNRDVLLSEGELSGPSDCKMPCVPVFLCLPQTYMNTSGKAIMSLAQQHKQARWLIFHDELDVSLGQVRLSVQGGTNGHNGLRDIQQVLGPTFYRWRLGIGRPTTTQGEAGVGSISHYVLAPFPLEQRQRLEGAMAASMPALWQLVGQGQPERCAKTLRTISL